jgi:hypothetical protein
VKPLLPSRPVDVAEPDFHAAPPAQHHFPAEANSVIASSAAFISGNAPPGYGFPDVNTTSTS